MGGKCGNVGCSHQGLRLQGLGLSCCFFPFVLFCSDILFRLMPQLASGLPSVEKVKVL